MQKNDVLKHEDALVRVLAIEGEQVLIVNSTRITGPRCGSVAQWIF